MKTIEIVASLRTETGSKSAKASRAEGNIPCVMYGGGENIYFEAPYNAFRDLIYTSELRKAAIQIGEKTYEAVIKEYQQHPVTDRITHIDFQALEAEKAVKLEMPLRFVGLAAGVRAGGKLLEQMRKVKVLVTPEAMASFIEVDVSSIELGKSLRVRDIPTSEGVQIMASPSIPIVSVEIPRALRSAQARAAAEGK